MSIACPSLIGDRYPELCTAVDHYCERTSSGFDAEPINALTNVAFLVAAWAAWWVFSRYPSRGKQGLVLALIATIALVGLGSFLFHTVATRWAEWVMMTAQSNAEIKGRKMTNVAIASRPNNVRPNTRSTGSA